MTEDERGIRALVAAWLEATKAGNHERILDLMTDDVVFLVPGAAPFGKAAFAQAAAQMRQMQIDGHSEIQELVVQSDWAYLRSRIAMTITSPSGGSMNRAGYALTILRKEPDGRWRIARDANLLAAQPQ